MDLRLKCKSRGHDLTLPGATYKNQGGRGYPSYDACVECNRINKANSRARIKKNEVSERRLRLEERKTCVNGHPVTKDSIRVYPPSKSRPTGFSYCLKCRRAASERHMAKKPMEDTGGMRQFVTVECTLECGDKNYFSIGFPSQGDVVYCYRCQDYTTVVGRERIFK